MNRKRGVLHIHNRENILEKRALVLDADRVALLDRPAAEDLSGLLVDRGALSYDDYTEAQKQSVRFKISPSEYARRHGMVTDEDVESSFVRLHEELVLEIFLWKNVGFSLDEASFPEDGATRNYFNLDLMVMEAARRQDEWHRVVDMLEGGRDLFAKLETVPDDMTQLSAVDRIVLDYLDGVRGTPQVMTDAGLPRYHVDISIGNLVECGFIRRLELDDLIEER